MRKGKMVQLTIWSKPKEMIDTQYGFIGVANWLEKEQRRIMADKTRTAEIRSEARGMALFVDDRRIRSEGYSYVPEKEKRNHHSA
jgi:hypothetical protein